jgi:hypothetical protein
MAQYDNNDMHARQPMLSITSENQIRHDAGR